MVVGTENQQRVDVVVLGAGVIGLTSALQLLRAGLSVTVVSADWPPDNVSSVAGAWWWPPSDKELTGAAMCSYHAWASVTMTVLAKQAEQRVPGVVWRSGRRFFRRRVPLPWWQDLVPEIRRVRSDELPAGSDYVDGYAFRSLFVDMSLYLPWLLERIRSLDGRLETRYVDSLATVRQWYPSRFIVNATGLGARRLSDVADTQVYPIRGQAVLLHHASVTEFVGGPPCAPGDVADPQGISTYVVPRCNGILVVGGTSEPDVDYAVPDPGVCDEILRRAVSLFPDLASGTRVGNVAGIRPARRGGVRLELQADVVHNYGHAGSGVMLAWGCARNVCSLISHAVLASDVIPARSKL